MDGVDGNGDVTQPFPVGKDLVHPPIHKPSIFLNGWPSGFSGFRSQMAEGR